MPELPRGTVTFVFTDIEGSTELLKRLGDGYAEVLGEHRRIVRDAFTAADGIEIDMQGDAFFFVFPRARDALAGAVEAQRAHAEAPWPSDAVVRVRMGLHTGEPAVHEEGYVGLDVVRAARICTLGNGGQILLSETTRALIGSGLPEGVSVFPLGQRHLRGIDEPEKVFEVEIEGLEEPEPRHEDVEGPAPPAPPAPSQPEGGRRVEAIGAQMAEAIQERVLGALEQHLGRGGSNTRATRSSGADELADRMGSLAAEIEERVAAALERKRRPPGP